MDNTSEKPVLIFIDDDDAFLARAADKSKDFFKSYGLNSQEPIKDLLNKILSFTPDYLIIDVNLHRGGCSELLVEELASLKGIKPTFKIWLISQIVGDHYKKLLERYQSLNSKVQNELIQKPVTGGMLQSIILSKVNYHPSDWEDKIPLPLRVVSKDLKVVYANKLWERYKYTPDTQFYSSYFESKPNKFDPEDYIGSFFKEGSIGFSVNSFWIRKNDELFLGQIIENHPLTQLPNNIDQAVYSVFKVMNADGYSRGRFYRVRLLAAKEKEAEKYSLTLMHLSEGHHEEVKVGYSIELRGELEKRVVGSKDIPSHQGILYNIRSKLEDDEVNDPDIIKLNKYLRVEDIDEWLEIPVFTKENRAVGFFVFDKGDSIIDGKNLNQHEIDERIKRINPIVNGLLKFIRSALEQDKYLKLLDYEKMMVDLDSDLQKNIKSEQRYRRILETIIETNYADLKTAGAIMVIRHGQSPVLSVDSAVGNVPDCVYKCNLPLDAIAHPIVATWKKGCANIIQDFKISKEKSNLERFLHDKKPDYWQAVSPEERDNFLQWLQSVSSVLIMPVIIQNIVIGSVAIYFTQDLNYVLNITKNKLKRSETVLTRARWVIQNALTAENEKNWQMALGHEMKTELYAAENFMMELEEKLPALKKEKYWLQSILYLQNSVDKGTNWVDMLRIDQPFTEALKGQFFPNNAIQRYINLNKYKLEKDSIKVSITPGIEIDGVWKTMLSGDENYFSRVVRILLHNAFKHGFAYAQQNDLKDIPVLISSVVKEEFWVLSIRNPGHMSSEEYKVRFEQRIFPSNRKVDGSHVGLSVALMITQNFNGKLKLENLRDNLVEVLVYWPIFKR